MENGRPTCLYCRYAMVVYEPVVVIEHKGERETSLGREPQLARRGHRALLVPDSCAPEAWRVATAAAPASG